MSSTGCAGIEAAAGVNRCALRTIGSSANEQNLTARIYESWSLALHCVRIFYPSTHAIKIKTGALHDGTIRDQGG